MARNSQMELRVSRLENDNNSIYDLLTDVQATQREHTERFDRVEAVLAEVVRRLPEPS